MASLVVNKQYSDPEAPTSSQLDAAFDSISTFFNITGIGADNIADDSIDGTKIEDGAITETKIVANAIGTPEIADASITLAKFAADLRRFFEPTGSIDAYAGDTAPGGYLLCDGSAVDRTTYATLFAITGIRYGTGDGVLTFNLPDLRGQFLRGTDLGSGRDPEVANRTAMATGGNVGSLSGSAQLDDWKYPEGRTSSTTLGFSVLDRPSRTGTLLGIDVTSGIGGGAFGGPGNGYDPDLGGLVQTPVLGNASSAPKLGLESRPKNVSTVFIIKV